MPRACTICGHPKRDDIDAAIVRGDSSRAIAESFSVSPSAVLRHGHRHLSAALATMRTEQQVARRDALLDRIEGLIGRAETLYGAAHKEGKASQALAVLKELRGLLELLGKATGELNDRPQVTLNLLSSPEWMDVRALLFAALQPHPEARAAVAARLLELKSGE